MLLNKLEFSQSFLNYRKFPIHDKLPVSLFRTSEGFRRRHLFLSMTECKFFSDWPARLKPHLTRVDRRVDRISIEPWILTGGSGNIKEQKQQGKHRSSCSPALGDKNVRVFQPIYWWALKKAFSGTFFSFLLRLWILIKFYLSTPPR